MEFSWGIETEAMIYCNSAKNALLQAPPDVQQAIQSQAAAWVNFGIHRISYSDAINEIVKYAIENNKEQGWDPTDEDGISWFLGIHCKAYDIACGKSSRGFSEIFKDAFIKHFSEIEDPSVKRVAALKNWMENQNGVPPCSIDPLTGDIKWNI